MTYEMNVVICDPETPKGMTSDLAFTIDCYFAHDSETYGNGYWLSLVKRGREGFENCIDLRYDRSFHPDQKIAYLANWAQNYWSGKDGAYILREFNIRRIAE